MPSAVQGVRRARSTATDILGFSCPKVAVVAVSAHEVIISVFGVQRIITATTVHFVRSLTTMQTVTACTTDQSVRDKIKRFIAGHVPRPGRNDIRSGSGLEITWPWQPIRVCLADHYLWIMITEKPTGALKLADRSLDLEFLQGEGVRREDGSMDQGFMCVVYPAM